MCERRTYKYLFKLVFVSLSRAGLIHTSTTKALIFDSLTIHMFFISVSFSVLRAHVDTYLLVVNSFR